LSNKSTKKFVGSGLRFCRKLATQSGGDVKCESKLGEGSKFSFWIKIAKTKQAGTGENNIVDLLSHDDEVVSEKQQEPKAEAENSNDADSVNMLELIDN